MRAASVVLLVGSALSFAQIKSPDPSSFEVEPPLLIPDRREDAAAREPKPPSEGPEMDVSKLEKQLERARRNAASAERFWKMGALSRVEAEQRILRFTHLQSDLADARLAAAKDEMLRNQNEPVTREAAKQAASPVESNLTLAIEAAHTAAANRERADIEAAEANVGRQKKLLAFGRARKSDVAKAEQKLAELKSQKN